MTNPYQNEEQEREKARFAAIEAALPFVPAYGWSTEAMRRGAGEAADLLFPGGPAEMVECYIAFADARMVAGAAPAMDNLRLSQRVRTLIATRLAQAEGERGAVRRALAVLALPGGAGAAARSLAHTVDTIWFAAGDTSADFSWYTKRAILAAVYTSTLLFWLNGDTDQGAALGFLDRRLAGVGRLGKWRTRFAKAAA
jgi:ubiquinone biosynthesis protein COQ9